MEVDGWWIGKTSCLRMRSGVVVRRLKGPIFITLKWKYFIELLWQQSFILHIVGFIPGKVFITVFGLHSISSSGSALNGAEFECTVCDIFIFYFKPHYMCKLYISVYLDFVLINDKSGYFKLPSKSIQPKHEVMNQDSHLDSKSWLKNKPCSSPLT